MKESSGTFILVLVTITIALHCFFINRMSQLKKRVLCVPLIVMYSFWISFHRYSYDPFQQSPNENPEAELAINAGDYLLVWGNMDEVN
jgi:hypothetical protein